MSCCPGDINNWSAGVRDECLPGNTGGHATGGGNGQQRVSTL